jgi:hypothetical protein
VSVYKAWKACERRAAKLFGGKRLWRPDFSESIPDGETDDLAWDCKAFKSIASITWFVTCEKKYREYTGPEREFIMYLFSTSQPRAGDFVLCRASHYEQLRRKARAFDAP